MQVGLHSKPLQETFEGNLKSLQTLNEPLFSIHCSLTLNWKSECHNAYFLYNNYQLKLCS